MAIHGMRQGVSGKLRTAFFFLLFLPLASFAAPIVFFSDIDSGPKTGGQDDKGVFVTVWGKGFGATRGTSTVTIGGGTAANYPVWSDTKVTFQLGANAASGNIVVTSAAGASNGVPFTVRAGRIFFVSAANASAGDGSFANPWSSPASFYNAIQPGDTAYFRTGTYNGNYGGNWGSRNFALGSNKGGTTGNPVAFVGYPGEQAVFQAPAGQHSNIIFTDGSSDADYVTVSNLTFIGAWSCISGGGFWQDVESGGRYIRIVGNVLSAPYGSSNTMTGLLTVQGDGWRVWGNELKDTGVAPPINNNHGIYVQVGSDDVDIGWNYFHNLVMGHVIQVHTDNYYLYENVRIHDNVLTATNIDDSRGINVGRVLPGSYGAIYNNVLYNLGQGFSGVAIYCGEWKIYNNTLYKVKGSSNGMIWVSNQNTGECAASGRADVRNNILYSSGFGPYIGTTGGATASQLTISNNLYFGYSAGSIPSTDPAPVNADPQFVGELVGNFQLSNGSPAIDKGTSIVNAVVTADFNGNARPQGTAPDIGALESTGTVLPKPTNVRLQKKP